MNRRRIRIGAVVIAAYALAMGVLVGMVTERIRFDHKRAVVLREYEEKTARVRRWLMELEADTSRGDALPATSLLEQEVISIEQPFRTLSRLLCREASHARPQPGRIICEAYRSRALLGKETPAAARYLDRRVRVLFRNAATSQPDRRPSRRGCHRATPALPPAAK